jgi:hypothetical protein
VVLKQGGRKELQNIGKDNSMLYRDFDKTGWQVSVIGMGAWSIGNQ